MVAFIRGLFFVPKINQSIFFNPDKGRSFRGLFLFLKGINYEYKSPKLDFNSKDQKHRRCKIASASYK